MPGIYAELIVPDYQVPAAVMVPHYQCDITPLLEEIATRISKTCGVLLLSRDKDLSQSFLATQEKPENFSLITAPFDTPWIRDRSPVAIRRKAGYRWCIPDIHIDGRDKDAKLFRRICANVHPVSPVYNLPQGNMVAGAKGLLFITREVLRDSRISLDELGALSSEMGVREWIIFSGFKNEITGHADVHVRVLAPKLVAVAWSTTVKADREKMNKLIKKIRQYDETIEILKIPMCSKGKQYASLVNWIQLGKRLIIPRYPLTPEKDIRATNRMLEAHGFKVEYIYSPTLPYAGSLHCLTASIYI